MTGLTSLPNRTLFTERARHALDRRVHGPLAICFLDLDDFKLVNDVHGHHVGDELLFAVGERLRECLRPEDTVARLGGDEFAILLEDTDLDTALAVVGRIEASLQEPVRLQDTELVVRTSIGVATLRWSEQYGGPDDLGGRRGDVRREGRGRPFGTDLRPGDARRERGAEPAGGRDRPSDCGRRTTGPLPADHRSAHGGRVAVEALVRWQHPRRGLLWPIDFLEHAEASGQIAELDAWVLNTVCHEAARWGDGGPK